MFCIEKYYNLKSKSKLSSFSTKINGLIVHFQPYLLRPLFTKSKALTDINYITYFGSAHTLGLQNF